MKLVTLGQMDFKVSLLGLGTVKWGRTEGLKYPASFELPLDNEIEALLEASQARGINLLDTAPAYGHSEQRLGKLLSNRHDWVIATKVGETFIEGRSSFDFSRKATGESIKRSLKRLNTEYLDIVLVHSDGHDLDIINRTDVLETLADFKSQGLIRSYGMSTKTLEGGIKAAHLSDIVMVTLNPNELTELGVIEIAYQINKGVLIKKALASGHISKFNSPDPVHLCLNFALKTPGVHSVILGTKNLNHLNKAIDCIEAMEKEAKTN